MCDRNYKKEGKSSERFGIDRQEESERGTGIPELDLMNRRGRPGAFSEVKWTRGPFLHGDGIQKRGAKPTWSCAGEKGVVGGGG